MIAALAAAAVVTCTPMRVCASDSDVDCATPTEMIQWDTSDPIDLLEGFKLYVREGGGGWVMKQAIPCEWENLGVDGVFKRRYCRGLEFAVPMKRHCADCLPGREYEIAVTAYTLVGYESTSLSNTITICMHPVCDHATTLRPACN